MIKMPLEMISNHLLNYVVLCYETQIPYMFPFFISTECVLIENMTAS